MTDRRKLRQRRSVIDISDKFVRREITSSKEKANVAAEMRDREEEVRLTKKAEHEATIARQELMEQEAKPEREENWKPPESAQDFARQLARAHPTWDLVTTIQTAEAMWARYQLVRAALIAGLRKGRELRERSAYGLGWSWPELEPLTPQERGEVLAQVRKTVLA